MTINEDKLAYFRSQLGVSNGTLPDLEWQWLRTKVADPNRGSIPDMWFYYLNKVLGYAGSIGDMLPNLGYPLSASATGGGAAQYASGPAPSGFAWDFVTFNGERVTKSNDPVVALVRTA